MESKAGDFLQEMITFFIGKLGAFVSFFSGVNLVSGVTFLGFLAGLFLIYLMVDNFLYRAR